MIVLAVTVSDAGCIGECIIVTITINFKTDGTSSTLVPSLCSKEKVSAFLNITRQRRWAFSNEFRTLQKVYNYKSTRNLREWCKRSKARRIYSLYCFFLHFLAAILKLRKIALAASMEIWHLNWQLAYRPSLSRISCMTQEVTMTLIQFVNLRNVGLPSCNF